MEDVHVISQLMCLSASAQLPFLLRTLPRSVVPRSGEDLDVLRTWALTSMIGGEGTAKIRLASPKEVVSDI